jgi:hypothetical protein
VRFAFGSTSDQPNILARSNASDGVDTYVRSLDACLRILPGELTDGSRSP